MPIVFKKTAKGLHEIETRERRLSPRLRSTLILVDGKRTADDLRKLVPLGLEETLRGLIDEGFVEAFATAPVAAPPPPPLPRPSPAAAPVAPPATGGADYLQVRREAVRALNDQLGPSAESLAIKMERASSAAELRPLLEAGVKLIASGRGAAAAEAFRTRFIAD